MRAVVQRVASAWVTVENSIIGQIDRGLLVFVGVERGDGAADVQYIAGKIRDLRMFQDADDPGLHLNRSVQDVDGAVLVVSQFTSRETAEKAAGRPSMRQPRPTS